MMEEATGLTTGLIKNPESAHFSGMNATIINGDESSETVMDILVEPGLGAPLHLSLDEDKLFLVIEGRFAFRAGNQTFPVQAGDRIAVQKGDAHAFRNVSSRPSRLILVSSPRRHDCFFKAMAALPVPHDPSEVEIVCQRYQQQIIGPLP